LRSQSGRARRPSLAPPADQAHISGLDDRIDLDVTVVALLFSQRFRIGKINVGDASAALDVRRERTIERPDL
jgi:hypothetical protein